MKQKNGENPANGRGLSGGQDRLQNDSVSPAE